MNDRSLLYATLTPAEDRVYNAAKELARKQLLAGGYSPQEAARVAVHDAEAAVDTFRTKMRLQREAAQS